MEPGNVKVSEFLKRIAALENENDILKDVILGLVNQFSGYSMYKNRLCRSTMGLSDLEHAYNVMRLEDPHPAPEHECHIDGCHEKIMGGCKTSDGYKHLCSNHWIKETGADK